MFQIGDKVVYGIHGVCCVADSEERIVDKKQVTYLVLEPIEKDGSKYLVPTHNASAMGKLRHLLSRKELEALVISDEVRADGWITDENRRKQVYRELIGSGDRGKLMCMVHALYRHRESQAAAGRKCHLCDENFLRDAEKLLASEVSVIMDMDQMEARQYLRTSLHA